MRAPLSSYRALCTEFYDLELERDEAAAADFYLDLGKAARGPILEPMCGTGRFLIPMLQAGLDAEGFDASPHMLTALQKKCAGFGIAHPPVWQQFVQDFASSKRYKLIFVPFGSWGLITDRSEAKKCLELMYLHLAPGGKLVLEVETVASLPEQLGVECRGSHARPDGSRVRLSTISSYDTRSQIFHALCRYESIRAGVVEAVENEEFLQYLYHFDELDQPLRDVGFNSISKLCDYAGTSAIDPQNKNLIYQCTRS
jgi:hypothetical protein